MSNIYWSDDFEDYVEYLYEPSEEELLEYINEQFDLAVYGYYNDSEKLIIEEFFEQDFFGEEYEN